MGPTDAPGLVLHATEDGFSNERMAREVADLLGARFATLPGLAHFWAVQDPVAGAAVLQRFWDAVR